jgi:hypothetical protein
MQHIDDSPRTVLPEISEALFEIGTLCEVGDSPRTGQPINRIWRNHPMKCTRQVGLTSGLSVMTGFLPVL